MKPILERVRDIVCEKFCVDPEQVMPESSFEDDLDCEVGEVIDLRVAVEDEFGVSLSCGELLSCVTVGNLVALLSERLQVRQ